jgi:hypothetical protein
MGDTKPPRKAAQATVEFPGVRVSQISGDKTLLLCQGETPRNTWRADGSCFLLLKPEVPTIKPNRPLRPRDHHMALYRNGQPLIID